MVATMITPRADVALELINRGVTLTAFALNDEGKKVPWAKGWSSVEALPLTKPEDITSCIRAGCHGFQMRAIDAGLAVIDIDIKSGKNGLIALEQACKLHGVAMSKDMLTSGYVVATPNGGCHIYVRPDEWLSSCSEVGILEGIDLLCDRTRLVIVEGSIGLNKESGEFRHYESIGGTINNAQSLTSDLSGMFQRIVAKRKQDKEAKRQERMAKLSGAPRQYSDQGSIFDDAKKRIDRNLISILFDSPGAEWKSGPSGLEFFTLNPTRADNSIGSFSIREDGIYSDFADSSCAGDLIELLQDAYNLTPLDAARLIIRETGGNPDDYDKPKAKPLPKVFEPITAEPEAGNQGNLITEIKEEPKPRSTMFPLKRLCDFTMEEEPWIVDRYFQGDSLALVYGKPGSGKSFWVLDLSLCIATGKEFHGNEVKQGPVVYMAGEGHRGITKRATAWQKHHKVDAKQSPWWLAGKPFDLIDTMSVAGVLEAIDHHTQGVNPTLVVIDTLARNFGAGDENKTSDMGAVIRHADAIRVKYNCLVIIVHHSGHDSDRARGSSSLKAAMDFEYCVTQPEENQLLVQNTRMKDGDKPADMGFRMEDLEIGGTYKWGEPIKSAVLIKEAIEAGKKKKAEYLGENQRHVYETLVMLYEEKQENLKDAFMDDSGAMVPKFELVEKSMRDKMDKPAVYRIIKALVEKKLIQEFGNDLVPVQV